MNKHRKKLLCIISFAVVVGISFGYTKSVQADENFRVAKIKSFSGTVKIGKGGGEKTFDAIEGMSLVEGDSITTEKDSSVLLYIDDDKEVKIGDSSIVNLSELSGHIESDDQKTGISLWVGKIFSNIKKKLKIRSKYEIKVPTAVMGVRGTEFSVESLADGDIKVILLEGTVTAVRTSVDEAEKYTTFEVTITKDESASMNQNDESQDDIIITGIKVNEVSQFVLETLKDFIERNPESLDENAKKEVYDEIDKRIAEKSVMKEDDSGIEKPVIKMDSVVERNMYLSNIVMFPNSEVQNMQLPNVQPEGFQDNQLLQTTLLNAAAGAGAPINMPMSQIPPPPPPQQGLRQPETGQPTLEQGSMKPEMERPKPEELVGKPEIIQPTSEEMPKQPMADEPKSSSAHKGGGRNSNEVNVTTPVISVNNPPSVQNSSVETEYSTKASGIIDALDVNGDTLSYTLKTQAAHGTAAIDFVTGEWDYTPSQQFIGTDSFVVTVSDGKGGSVASIITVIVMPQNPQPVNIEPTTQNSSVTTEYNKTASGTITAFDANGDALSYAVTTAAGNGTATVDSTTGAWKYTPNQSFSGIDSFVVTVNDGEGGSVASTVTVTVIPQVLPPVNTPPIAQNKSESILQDTAMYGLLIVTDSNVNTALTYTVTSQPTNGSVTVSSTGNYTYTPNANYVGTDSFKFKANDGTLDSNEATVSITVMSNVQGLKSILNNKINEAQGWASTTVGNNATQCSSQTAIDQLNVAITNSQNIMYKTDATVDEVNGAITALQNAIEQVKNNIVNTLMVFTVSGDGSVSANSNFDEVIKVEPNIGKFLNTFSSNNITLGGDFTGLTIKSVSVPVINNYYIAQIELSGNLSRNTGVGTITINAAGWESTVNSKDITASIIVK